VRPVRRAIVAAAVNMVTDGHHAPNLVERQYGQVMP
jgi:hypothetical protein